MWLSFFFLFAFLCFALLCFALLCFSLLFLRIFDDGRVIFFSEELRGIGVTGNHKRSTASLVEFVNLMECTRGRVCVRVFIPIMSTGKKNDIV